MPVGPPSLEWLSETARHEGDAQAAHFESLDTKAGIVLGFFGTLVVLSRVNGVIASLGRVAAVLSAFLALLAFVPRVYPVLRLQVLRDLALGSGDAALREAVDAEMKMVVTGARALHAKGARLRLSLAVLAIAISLESASMLGT